MNSEEIFPVMRALIADCLAITAERVSRSSRLFDDLSADSLDLVDILFQIEKKFGVQIRTQELNFFSGLNLTSPAAVQDGVLAPEAVERLKEWVPALAQVPDPSRVTPRQLFELVSVETLCRLVEKKVRAAGV